jgi:hypothetical protein
MSEAWVCPACGRGVAPGATTCEHGGEAMPFKPLPNSANPWPTPYLPLQPYPPYYPPYYGCEACRYSGVCMCVNYPHRWVTTCGSPIQG